MKKELTAPCFLEGEISPPGDKSMSHRAVIMNSIAEGNARIVNFCPSDDCRSTVRCLQALGVNIEVSGQEVIVLGAGKQGLREADDVLDAGNSGTTMRLLSGLLAAQPFLSLITGDASLRSRPMDRVIGPLRLMGAQIWGRKRDTRAPLAIRGGQLHGIRYALPVASAQVKSALLLAALYADGETTITEPLPTRDHTERLMKAMGVQIETKGNSISVAPGSPKSADLVVPGDISSAAYWLVAAAIHPRAKVRATNVGINPTRDGIIEVLRAMGAKLKIENERIVSGEPVADLVVESSELHGVEIGGALIPRLIDEIPVIAVAALKAKGMTVVRDAAELRVKESDRIASVVSELSRLGADIEECPDGMIIRGGKNLHGAETRSHHDHRLAMALGIASTIAPGATVIEDAEACTISYPTFWEELDRLSHNGG